MSGEPFSMSALAEHVAQGPIIGKSAHCRVLVQEWSSYHWQECKSHCRVLVQEWSTC